MRPAPSAPARFTFDTEFRTEGDIQSNAARARAKRAYTHEEIDHMCSRARAEGIKSGQVRAAEETAAAAAQSAMEMRAVLHRMDADLNTLRAEAAQIALACARRLAGAALNALPAQEVDTMVREAMHHAIGEPRLMLHAAQNVIDALRPGIEAAAHEEGFEGRVMLVPDAMLRGADCRVEWRGGGAERCQDDIEQAIAALITRNFSSIQNTPTENEP